MSRRKAAPPPVPDDPHQADSPAAAPGEVLTLGALVSAELFADYWFRQDARTRTRSDDELLWGRQAYDAARLAVRESDPALRRLKLLAVEKGWSKQLAADPGWRFSDWVFPAAECLQLDHGLTFEQAYALPLPQVLDKLGAKPAGVPGDGHAAGPADSHAGALPWEGDDWDDLMPQTRRLLRHMYDRERDMIADFAEIVWERPYENVSDRAINTAVSRANHFLNKRGHKRLLSKVRGEPVVRWV